MKRRTAPEDRSTRTPRVFDRRDVAARVEWAIDAGEAGDVGAALDVLRDLLEELVPAQLPSKCPECGLPMWPGQLPRHLSVVHGIDPYAKAA